MKSLKFIAVMLVFGAISYAALPDTITDPKQRDAIEYLDGKINSVLVGGKVDIGVTNASATGTTIADAVCPADSIAIGGGGASNAACGQYASFKLNDTTWRTQCGSAVSMNSYVVCARVK